MAFLTDIHRFESGFAHRVNSVLVALQHQRARRAVYRQTYDELMALTNRDLNDLGLARSDIPTIARQAADQA